MQGKVEMWDTQSLKMVCPVEAPDTTHLEWSPDGQHFMTSTTAPRLRVGNGSEKFQLANNSSVFNDLFVVYRFKIWHYSGVLLHEHHIQAPVELWESSWQPSMCYKEFKVSARKVAGIQPSQPQGKFIHWMNIRIKE